MKIKQGARRNRVRGAANIGAESGQTLTPEIEKEIQGVRVALRDAPELPDRIFRLALNEARALAWQTGYPLLVYPDLAVEKIQAATKWNARQRLLRPKISVPAMSN